MVRWIAIIFMLYCVFWFIGFQINPYNLCKDHPDRDLKDHYYLCQPFDLVEWKKGFLENKDKIPVFVQPNSYYVPSDEQYQRQSRQKKCSDPRFRKTLEGQELCE